jgi:hypothetical protein
MTFEELDATLPNGFHDAEIYSIDIDYRLRCITLDINFWVGDLDGPNREEYRRGVLKGAGLHFCSIDPPDPAYSFVPQGSYVTVSGSSAKPDASPAPEKLWPAFPPGVSCYRFFVHNWNSFIHIAVRDAQLSWAEDAAPVKSITSGR